MKRNLLLLLCLAFVLSINAKVVYVTSTGSVGNDGSSWDKAVDNLTTAMTKVVAGDEIWMAKGTYVINETLVLADYVDIYGGFAGTETAINQRVLEDASKPWSFVNETVLTGNGGDYRLTDVNKGFDRTETTYIDGLTVSGHGTTNDKICYFNNNFVIQNCRYINNKIGGKALYVEENSIVRDCYFAGNSAFNESKQTGACALQGRECGKASAVANTILNCVFEKNSIQCLSIYNTATAAGDTYAAQTTKVAGCVFRDNTYSCLSVNSQWPASTEGTYTADRKVIVSDNLFENNVSEVNVISCQAYTSADFVRNVIRNNSVTCDAATGSNWKTAIVSLNNNFRMVNCLLVNNSSTALLMYQGMSTWVGNSTFANNVGSIYVAEGSYAELGNCIVLGNTATHQGKDIFCVDAADYVSYVEFTAVDGDNDDVSGDCITTTAAETFKKPTSFVGVAADDAQRAELAAADFSLQAGSVCIGAGQHDFEAMAVLPDWIEANLQTDLAGNDFVKEAGKVNMGAYQGDLGTGFGRIDAETSCQVWVYGNKLTVNVTAESADLTVYTVAGTVVANAVLQEGNNEIALQNGLYVVQIVTASGVETAKVLINE